MDKTLRLILLLLVLALAIPAYAQLPVLVTSHTGGGTPATIFPGWTLIQDSFNVNGCSGTSCTFTVSATTAGTVWVVAIATGASNVTISTVTGGSATFNACSPSCHKFNTGNDNVDMQYAFNGAAGTTSITVTISGTASSYYIANLAEFLPPAGTSASFDTAGTSCDGSAACSGNTASCSTTCHGVGLTLAGVDVVYQFDDIANSVGPQWNSWSSPYITNINSNGLYLNAPAGALAAPTFQQTSAGYSTISAIAFKASFTAQADVFTLKNYANPHGIVCTPTCPGITIPSTTAGNLLFVGEANLNGNHISTITCSGCSAFTIPSGANTCQITLTSTTDSQSCAYLLSVAGSITTLNVTMSANTTAQFGVSEVSRTSGSFVFDTQGSGQNTASFTPSGKALTLSGTNDVIFQGLFCPGGATWSTLYLMPHIPGQGAQILNANAWLAILINTNNGAAPAYNNPQNNATAAYGIAFQ